MNDERLEFARRIARHQPPAQVAVDRERARLMLIGLLEYLLTVGEDDLTTAEDIALLHQMGISIKEDL